MCKSREIFKRSKAPKGGFYLVGLVDILGQKQKLMELDEISIDERDKLHDQLQQNMKVVMALRNSFETTYDAFLNEQKIATKKKQFKGLEREAYEYCNNPPEIKFQGFSDTVVFYVALFEQNKTLPTRAVYLSLVAACSAISNLLACGHVIRGGIDVGEGCEIYENEIYGPALLRAYYLESGKEKANWPRILIGRELIKYLESILRMDESYFEALDLSHNEKQADYMRFGSELREKDPVVFRKYISLIKNDAKSSLKMIQKDKDGHMILDYFGKFILNTLGNKELSWEIYKNSLKFAASEREKFQNLGNKKLHSKYDKLSHYIQSRERDWIYTTVRTILLQADPIGIYDPETGNEDEYDSEIEIILKKLPECETIQEVQRMLWKVFSEFFSPSIAGSQESYLDLAKKIFNLK